jgi:hypothetical protein
VRRRLDRLVAASALALTAGALLVVTAVSHVALPPLALNDPRAAVRLYELMQRGERATYIVDYAFTRGDGGFRSTETEARARGVRLSRSGTTLLIQRNGIAYDCELAEERSGCQRLGPVGRSLPDSVVMRVANLAGAYNIIRTGDRTIAGEQAECFRMTATGASHVLQDVGNEEDACYASDGIPLRTRLSGPSTHPTERVAQDVLRTWDQKAITRILAGFESPPLGH